MNDERYKKIIRFEEGHSDLPDGAFFALAEESGIMPEDFIEAEEWHAEKEAEKTAAAAHA